jgi:hypothetical protein
MRKILFTLVCIISFILSSCSDDPQQIITPPPEEPTYGIISGGIYDSVGGKALGGVEITTSPPTRTVTSTETGFYLIDSIPTGQYTVFAHKEKYDDLDTLVTIQTNTTSYINLYMYPSNSNWTYYATLPEYKNGGLYTLTDGTLFSFQSDVFINVGGNNGQFVYGTHILPPNTQNWTYIFNNDAPSSVRENPYNNYAFCSTRDVIHYFTGNTIATADLHVSVNNGQSWQNRIPGNVYSMTFAPNNICFAVSILWTGSTEINKLYKSSDGGRSWDEIDPIPGFKYSSVKQLFNNRIYLMGYSNDTARYSDDYGQTWIKKLLSYNEQNMIRGCILLQNNALLTTYYEGSPYFGYSYDNGNTWTQRNEKLLSKESKDNYKNFLLFFKKLILHNENKHELGYYYNKLLMERKIVYKRWLAEKYEYKINSFEKKSSVAY